MTRWLLVPLSLAALVVATPTSEAGLFGRKKSCNTGSDCAPSGPTQCIVGWKTEMQKVTVHEWVTEKQKVNVTEYQTVEEKRKVTYHKTEKVKEARQEKYWECVPVTTEETREYTVYNEVRENKKGTRQVCRPITTEETVKRTYDRGHWVTTTCEVPCYSSSRRGFCCKKGCDSDCVTYRTVCQKHWVSKLETVEEKVKVTRHVMVEEAYDYVAISHKPEKKSEKVKVTRHQNVEKSREVVYWVCRTVPVTEEITVKVCKPITVEKVVDVRVCRAVTKEVEVKTPIYGVVECAQPAPVYYDCGSSNSCGRTRKGCCGK